MNYQNCTISDQKQTEKTPHIFISYQWTSQKTVLQIRDILRNNGYKVWMDVDGMSKYSILY